MYANYNLLFQGGAGVCYDSNMKSSIIIVEMTVKTKTTTSWKLDLKL